MGMKGDPKAPLCGVENCNEPAVLVTRLQMKGCEQLN